MDRINFAEYLKHCVKWTFIYNINGHPMYLHCHAACMLAWDMHARSVCTPGSATVIQHAEHAKYLTDYIIKIVCTLWICHSVSYHAENAKMLHKLNEFPASQFYFIFYFIAMDSFTVFAILIWIWIIAE